MPRCLQVIVISSFDNCMINDFQMQKYFVSGVEALQYSGQMLHHSHIQFGLKFLTFYKSTLYKT